MAQSARLWSRRSPNTGGDRGEHSTQRGHHGAVEDDDWETDPDYINSAPRQGFRWAQQDVSTTSIISDLSKSIRDCTLRKSSSSSRKDYPDRQSCSKDSAWKPGKDPTAPRSPLSSQVRSSPSLGIERSSVFHCNAAETLDTFFSEKLRTWGEDAAQLSDCYENVESLQEEPTCQRRAQRRAEKEYARSGQTRGKDHSQTTQSRDVVRHSCGSRDHYAPGMSYGQCPMTHKHHLAGKGEATDGPSHMQEGSRLSSPVTTSTRILPQCQITHVQSCRACQAFNQDLPPNKEVLYGNCGWGPLQEGARDAMSTKCRKRRTESSSHRPDQLLKVEQWLEQTPVEEPLGQPRTQKHKSTHRSLDPTERGPWDRGGSPEPPAETRRGRKIHRGENPNHQPIARILACDDSGTAPATCSCLFCERQHRRAKSVAGRRGSDPSAEEVAVQLQAENRVPRIVEAFERRSLREAKRAEWERAFQSEKRAKAAKPHGDARRGHPQSCSKARRSHPREEPQEEPRPSSMPEEPHKPCRRKEGDVVWKQPSFIGRLRGLY